MLLVTPVLTPTLLGTAGQGNLYVQLNWVGHIAFTTLLQVSVLADCCLANCRGSTPFKWLLILEDESAVYVPLTFTPLPSGIGRQRTSPY